MDLEKVKKNYKWDPMSGDYSKSFVSYERRLHRRKQNWKWMLILLYVLIIITSIVLLFKKFS